LTGGIVADVGKFYTCGILSAQHTDCTEDYFLAFILLFVATGIQKTGNIKMKRRTRFSLITLLVFAFPATMYATPLSIYSNNFDGSEIFAGGVSGSLTPGTTSRTGIMGVQDYTLDGFSGNMLVSNGTSATRTTLELTNLPEHDSISLGFLLATINSWDGTSNALATNTAPDFFNVLIDSTVVFSETFRNIENDPNSPQSFDPPAGSLLSIGNERWTMGSPNPGIDDAAYDMSLVDAFQSISHSGSSLLIEFYAGGNGWQPNAMLRGDWDEAWGIENIEVSLNIADVPEPATLFLISLGLFGLGVTRRKRV